jgi:hypothetical protein
MYTSDDDELSFDQGDITNINLVDARNYSKLSIWEVSVKYWIVCQEPRHILLLYFEDTSPA